MTIEQTQALLELCNHTALLEQVRDQLARDGALKTRDTLQKKVDAETARALLDVAECQLRFSEKFEHAETWLLSREAAEQATRSTIAAWRATYLKLRLPHSTHLTEIGTGIGGDSVYLAREFVLQGYERDPARALLARQNVSKLSPEAASVEIHSKLASASELSGDILFVDPARRLGGRKFHPEDWDPPLSSLTALTGFRSVVIKTAPGLQLDVVPEGFEVHFLSHQGDLKEAMLLRTESLGSPRHAWLWAKGQPVPLHLHGEPLPARTRSPEVGEYLLNPDPALLRSGLLEQFCSPLGAGIVHPKIAYVSSPLPCITPWADSFRVLDVAPLKWKPLNDSLSRTGWGDFEYLGRGVPFSQAEVLAKLGKTKKKMDGTKRGSLIIYRDVDDYRVVLAEREPSLTRLSETGE